MNNFIFLILVFSCGLVYAGGQAETLNQIAEQKEKVCALTDADGLLFQYIQTNYKNEENSHLSEQVPNEQMGKLLALYTLVMADEELTQSFLEDNKFDPDTLSLLLLYCGLSDFDDFVEAQKP